MRGVDMCKIKWSLYEVFLKVMLTKYCTVEQKKRQGLKTHTNNNNKLAKSVSKDQKPLKTRYRRHFLKKSSKYSWEVLQFSEIHRKKYQL